MDYRLEYERCRDMVESRLSEFFTAQCDQGGLDIYCRNNAFPIAVKQRKGDSRYAEGHGIHGDADADDNKGRDKLIGKYGFPIIIYQSRNNRKQNKAQEKAFNICFYA